MNQTVELGMRPKSGRTERSQPKTRPEISAPPAVESVSGTPPTLKTIAPISAPSVMAAPMKATSATSLGRSAWPMTLATAAMSWVRPTIVRMSPRWITVLAQDRDADGGGAPNDLSKEDAACRGICESSASVLPSTSLLVT